MKDVSSSDQEYQEVLSQIRDKILIQELRKLPQEKPKHSYMWVIKRLGILDYSSGILKILDTSIILIQ